MKVSALPHLRKQCFSCETTLSGHASTIRSADRQHVIGLLCPPCTWRAQADEGFRFQIEAAVFHGMTRKALEETANAAGMPLAKSFQEQQALIRKSLGRRT